MVVETPGPIEKWKAEIATIRGLIAAPRARRRKPAGPSAAAPARAR
jgi:hypothetical protein